MSSKRTKMHPGILANKNCDCADGNCCLFNAEDSPEDKKSKKARAAIVPGCRVTWGDPTIIKKGCGCGVDGQACVKKGCNCCKEHWTFKVRRGRPKKDFEALVAHEMGAYEGRFCDLESQDAIVGRLTVADLYIRNNRVKCVPDFDPLVIQLAVNGIPLSAVDIVAGASFILKGFIFSEDTIKSDSEAVFDDRGELLPQFSEKVLGTWISKGTIIGIGEVVDTQIFTFKSERGDYQIITEGITPITPRTHERVIVGGCGRFAGITGTVTHNWSGSYNSTHFTDGNRAPNYLIKIGN